MKIFKYQLLLLLLSMLVFANTVIKAQTVVVTDDATYTTGQASSVLDVKSTTKGFLVPRMTTAQRTAVSSPADGLLVYQTDGLKGFYNYNTTTSTWIPLGSATGTNWTTTGNTGLSVTTNFIGTTDNTSMRFRTNNAFRMVIDSIGSVGIGSVNFDATNREKLLIDAGTTTSVTGLNVTGSINNFFQLNVRNSSNGTSASTDLIATADNGTQTTNYVDLGINSSGYTPTTTGKPDDGYLISQGNDFYIDNLNPTKDFIFGTGTGVKEIMRLTSTGHLGIGVSNPTTQVVAKDTIEIRRVNQVAELIFTNTAGTGDMKIAGDGGDIFWQGGGSRFLQMGSYWSTIIGGDRQTSTAIPFLNGIYNNTGTIIQSQRDPSVSLAVLGNSGSQSANLTDWRTSGGTTLSSMDNNGNLILGTSLVAATNPLTIKGVRLGATSDSILTIASGIVRKLPYTSVGAGAGWSTVGNAGTSSATNFLGTTDATSLRFRTNNAFQMVLDSVGSVGIGSTAFTTTANLREKLLVNAGSTTSTALYGYGNINNYLQLNIRNLSNGASASSDLIATADNGSETTNFVDLGINSSGNTGTSTGKANDGYLISNGNDFYIVNQSASKDIIFSNGTSNTERMRLTSAGNLGIGTNNPGSTLTVQGNTSLTGNTTTVGNTFLTGTVQIGTNGSFLSGIIKASFTITNTTAFTSGVTKTIIVPISNAVVGGVVHVSPGQALNNGIVIAYSYVSSAGNITIGFVNTTTTTLGSSIPFNVVIIQ